VLFIQATQEDNEKITPWVISAQTAVESITTRETNMKR